MKILVFIFVVVSFNCLGKIDVGVIKLDDISIEEPEETLESLDEAILNFKYFSIDYTQQAYDYLFKKNCRIEVVSTKMNVDCRIGNQNNLNINNVETNSKIKVGNGSTVRSCIVC